ncbi:hypothetical protein FC90_GL001526 [Latilactobacillus graminis DSM 20719]|uniref:Uncharacterized protein n=2 Tax=Latilactobacillus graminis TaxID=60519 RepID=A0AA89HZJ5_9LACO|nr:hypothetical protein FC90_GL001526 [Latilactobacillus graminis DSM 20719]
MGSIGLPSSAAFAATTSVGVTISGVTAEMTAKAQEAAANQAALAKAWLETEIDDSQPVEVSETIGAQTVHYWEAADGSRNTTAPAEIAEPFETMPTTTSVQTAHQLEATIVKDPPIEHFQSMPSKNQIDQTARAFKQLTTDWASQLSISSLEDWLINLKITG